jgi:hypothetical protein
MLALSLAAGSVAPIVMQAPTQAQTTFSDVSSNYWAAPYIQALAARGVISGFPDGTFRPSAPVTRAQYAAMVRQAFSEPRTRTPIRFVDVSTSYWGYEAINEAFATGFLSGYPGNVFRPEQNIPRVQVLVSLANGLNYTANNVEDTLDYYLDEAAIPNYARNSIAAATQKQLVVNYPTVRELDPNEVATRADVAAFIYQALVNEGEVAAIPSPYVVGQGDIGDVVVIPEGSVLPIRYDEAERILLSPEEPEPVPVTLVVSQNITNIDGDLLIPQGSQVRGELRVVEVDGEDGAQFFADELVFPNNQRFDINAVSEVITDSETITRGASLGEIVQNAALGAAAAAVIAEIDEAIEVGEVLGGAGVGALLGIFLGRDRFELITVDPDRDLNLTLTSDLTLD